METGYESLSDEELAKSWDSLMSHSTYEELISSDRFLRVCQELDERKINCYGIGMLISQNEPGYAGNL